MSNPERAAPGGSIEIPVHLVLLVDSDVGTTQFVTKTLASKQIFVRAAKDGGQARAAFQLYHPDFIILDVLLAGESGFELCEWLKSQDPQLPVLFLSSIEMNDARELAARVGADGYLTKPADAATLVSKVQEIAEAVWRRKHGPAPEEDRIHFACLCGKRFKVAATNRGKSLTCPQCGEPLVVPQHTD